MNPKIFNRLLWVLFLITIFKSVLIAEQKFTVRGRVVDEKGRGVHKAIVTLFPCIIDESFPDSVAYFVTPKDGTFEFPAEVPEFPTETFLYVTSPEMKQAFALIEPPFRSQSNEYLITQYSCPKVLINRSLINIGDVRIQIHYEVVKIQLINEDGSHVMSLSGDWPSCDYEIRNDKGQSLGGLFLREIDCDRRNSCIKMALPHGTWQFAVSIGERTAKTTLVINKHTPLKITMRFPGIETR
jgi:hypothetical protein